MLSQAQLDGMKLKFKFTFIDVEEPSSSLRHCASMPAVSTYHQSVAQCENDYLAGLLQEARIPLPIPQAEIASAPMPTRKTLTLQPEASGIPISAAALVSYWLWANAEMGWLASTAIMPTTTRSSNHLRSMFVRGSTA